MEWLNWGKCGGSNGRTVWWEAGVVRVLTGGWAGGNRWGFR